MRINIYSEEVTDRVEITLKEANGVAFRGICFFVGKKFEHTPGDDDSSAVTFWFSGPYENGLLRTAFQKALKLLGDSATQS